MSKFKVSQVVRHIRDGGEYKIKLGPTNLKMKTPNGEWVEAFVYTDGVTYFVRSRAEMEQKFEAIE